MNKIGKNIQQHSFTDETIEKMCRYKSDAPIIIETCDSTLGDVARWMAAYIEEDIPKITKENYKKYNEDCGIGHFNRWDDNVIKAGGNLCYYISGSKHTRTCKHATGYNWSKEYPVDTPWIKMIGDYIDDNWDNEVHVVSFYSGNQGLLTITVYDVKGKCALFSITSLEMFGYFRAR